MHIAVIMDGNGRWSQKRSHPRVWGHIRGAHVVSKIVQAASDLKINTLTMYAFSTENWSRPYKEVTTLFLILKKFLKKEKNRILANNIKFTVIGDVSALPESTQDLISELKDKSFSNTGLRLIFAFNYGARSEIIAAANSLKKDFPDKLITETELEKYLYTKNIPDVDLLIRTGGDQRLSNFLLWQSAYAELFFTKTMWPDFTIEEFNNIIAIVKNRERRFGAISKLKCLKESKDISSKQAFRFKEN